MSLFQSNLRKQIRNLPKILNFVKIIHYYSKLFTGVLSRDSVRAADLECRAARRGYALVVAGVRAARESGARLAHLQLLLPVRQKCHQNST